jgi:hypothetical protein
MSKTDAERSKARYLRRQLAGGKTLTPEQQQWMHAYNDSGRAPRGSSHVSAPSTAAPSSRTAPPSSSARVLLSVPDVTSAPAAAAVPMLPPASPPEGAPAPAEGQAPPPDEPVVTTGPTEAELTAGADKLALGVVLLAKLGLAAGLELAPDDLPFREDLASEKAQNEVLGIVGAAARRVALKYGISVSVPYEDELVVAAAVGGSIAAMVAVRRRRKEEPEVGPITDRVRKAKDVTTPTPAESAPAPSMSWGAGWTT